MKDSFFFLCFLLFLNNSDKASGGSTSQCSHSFSLSLSLNIMMVVMRDNRQKVSLSNEDATRVVA